NLMEAKPTLTIAVRQSHDARTWSAQPPCLPTFNQNLCIITTCWDLVNRSCHLEHKSAQCSGLVRQHLASIVSIIPVWERSSRVKDAPCKPVFVLVVAAGN